MHRSQTYNFRFQLLRQKIVSACNIATVCCNLHVQENLLSSNRFTSIQSKTISNLSEFRVSVQNFRLSFWHPKPAVRQWTTYFFNGDLKLRKKRSRLTKRFYIFALQCFVWASVGFEMNHRRNFHKRWNTLREILVVFRRTMAGVGR